MEKRVLFVATVVKTHINVFHIPYLKWFKDQGYITYVCAKNDYDDEECHIEYCDSFYDIPFSRNPLSFSNIKSFLKLKEIIKKNHFEMIHCHTPTASVLARIAARTERKKGLKVFYTAHGFHFYKGSSIKSWLLYYPIELFASFFTDVMITINHEDYRFAQHFLFPKNLECVNGVGFEFKIKKIVYENKETFLFNEIGLVDEKVLLLSVGELTERKNHKLIIDALTKMRDCPIHYLVCGQGEKLEELKEYVKKKELDGMITFLGFRTDILNICSISDIFIFPSKQEGLPVALMEAMATSLPVVCSKIRGNVDLIEDNKGGFLCDNNNVEEYRKRLRYLIANEKIRKTFGKYNKDKVEKYNLENVLKEMIKIYLKYI